jgi:lipoprotein-anchoring transpeptidase ErfK/SrfK
VRRALPLLGLLAAACGGSHDAAPRPAPTPAFAVATPSPTPAPASAARPAAPRPAGRWLTARLRHPVHLRARPGGKALARLGTRTEFGSPRVLSVRRRRAGWLQVLAPERPNGRDGWIRADAVRLGVTDVAVRIDRSARRLTLLDGDRILRRVAVAVGRPGTPTPLGRFAVTDRLRTTGTGSPYGCCAIALSGHQTRLLPGWPGGDRLAIHATPASWTIGQAASLGCLRASPASMRALMRRVPLGAPVFVVR